MNGECCESPVDITSPKNNTKDNFDNISEFLTGRNTPRWTIWEIKGETPDGKKIKIIRKPDASPVPEGYKITENGGLFEDVVKICRKYPGKYYPGLYFIKDDGLIVMDSDNTDCPDFPTYTERSVSRNSFHTIGWYDKKSDCPVIKNIHETYTGPHWIVLTGDCLPGKNVINDMNDFLVPYITSVKSKTTGEPFKIQTDEKYKEGERYNTILKYVRSEKTRGHPIDVIMEGARALNKNHFEPPHKDEYIVHIVQKFWKMGNTKEFQKSIEEKQQIEEELKNVDISGITSKFKKASLIPISTQTQEYSEGIKLGPVIRHKNENASKDKKITVPPHLLEVPGILQEVVNYYNLTSVKDQPQFAVTTALALGIMVTQRRFVTDQKNYTSINMINVGDTSTGKEQLKSVLEELSIEAGLSNLIGPSGYTSAGGVFTALMKKPAHISIIDELGRQLGSAKKEKSSNFETAQTSMMEIFGRLGGVHRPPGYSNMSLLTKPKKEEKGESVSIEELYIKHPALAIIAMTTPDNFYESLSSTLIKDGFLPRFIVVETEYGRQPSKKIKPAAISPKLIEWMQRCAANKAVIRVPNGDPILMESDPKYCPEPTLITFSPECDLVLEKYERELDKKMDINETLRGMYGKTKEITMRLSLLVAISCNSNTIFPEHLNWAIDYITYYTDKLVERLGYALSDSDFEAVCNDIMRLIEKSETLGVTVREINARSRKAKAYPCDIIQKRIMPSLQKYKGIQFCYIDTDGSGKSKRVAWVSEKVAKEIDPTL